MALFEETLYGKTDKVQRSIDILKSFEPPEGYFLAFSGGKDSQTVYHLAKMAGVKFDAHYSVTSVDPPELVLFIKKHYPDVSFDHHYWNDNKPHHYFSDGSPKPITMWSLIADHTIPPTRQARYCCASLKETSGKGRVVVTGVRWAESQNRRKLHGIADIQTQSRKLHNRALSEDPTNTKVNKGGGLSFLDDNDTSRKMVEQCYQKNKVTINPIVDWEEEDVWEFIKDVAKVPYCELYDQGMTRLGCIGCPLQGRDGMLADFERWPKYKQLYIKAFDNMIANHPGEIKVATGESVEADGAEKVVDGWVNWSHGKGKREKSKIKSEISDNNSIIENESSQMDLDAQTAIGIERTSSVSEVSETALKFGAGLERTRFDQWNGKEIYDTWIWSFGTEKERQAPPPAPLRPNRTNTKGRKKQRVPYEEKNGDELLTRWVWNHRSQNEKDEPNPILSHSSVLNKAYNNDSSVADYEDANEVLELFYGKK